MPNRDFFFIAQVYINTARSKKKSRFGILLSKSLRNPQTAHAHAGSKFIICISLVYIPDPILKNREWVKGRGQAT